MALRGFLLRARLALRRLLRALTWGITIVFVLTIFVVVVVVWARVLRK